MITTGQLVVFAVLAFKLRGITNAMALGADGDL